MVDATAHFGFGMNANYHSKQELRPYFSCYVSEKGYATGSMIISIYEIKIVFWKMYLLEPKEINYW